MPATKCLEFEKLANGNLKITLLPEGREELAEMKTDHPEWTDERLFLELAEQQLCNGWTTLPPEDIGALTGALILTDDCERDDDGKLTNVGRVYWFDRYQVDGYTDRLEERGEVVWSGTID